mmetsp:Transcript_3869/g.15621  ORF Transcript_3869/g.15621 Transcript_3869/m.15621 type:complete len:289 (-) Transcript_3869:368-1234(-)
MYTPSSKTGGGICVSHICARRGEPHKAREPLPRQHAYYAGGARAEYQLTISSSTSSLPGSRSRLCHIPSNHFTSLSRAPACACRCSDDSGSTEVSWWECSVRKGVVIAPTSLRQASVACRYSFAILAVVPTVRELRQRGSRSISSCKNGNFVFTAPAGSLSVGQTRLSNPTTGRSTALAGCRLACSSDSMGATSTAPSKSLGRRCIVRTPTHPPIEHARRYSGTPNASASARSFSAMTTQSSTRSSKRFTNPRPLNPGTRDSERPKDCWSYACTLMPSALRRAMMLSE